jgi:hypothetical protein
MRLRTRGKVVFSFWACRLTALRTPSHGATQERIVCKAVNRGKFGPVSVNSGRKVLQRRIGLPPPPPPPPVHLNFLSIGLPAFPADPQITF